MAHLYVDLPLNKVIFHSYLSLLEGKPNDEDDEASPMTYHGWYKESLNGVFMADGLGESQILGFLSNNHQPPAGFEIEPKDLARELHQKMKDRPTDSKQRIPI